MGDVVDKFDVKKIALYGALLFIVLGLIQGWEAITQFVTIVLTAIVPLVLGAAIAYVVSIPLGFFERHFFPNSTSKAVTAIRRPVCLAVTLVLLLSGISIGVSTLIPALSEVITIIQLRGADFIEQLIQQPVFVPFRASVHKFLQGDLVKSLETLDLGGIMESGLGGTVGSFGNQLFSVVSIIMSGFFGILFSFILLTDTTHAVTRLIYGVSVYVGPKKMERIALVMGVADSSFHNFIVRQFTEAIILGTIGTISLLVMGFEYALGVGVFLGLAAIVPIVGYPVGLIGGAFIVVLFNPIAALVFLACVALTQMLESTMVLPHIGDPRTTLPPVWITVAVTIGGGIAGFVGMIVAIPTASTIYQLICIDLRRRGKLLDENLNLPEDADKSDEDKPSVADESRDEDKSVLTVE